MRLSPLASSEARRAPAQFLFWFVKSYSRNATPPGLLGSMAPVCTSKTPQPQAQAKTEDGKDRSRTSRTARKRFIKTLSRAWRPRGRASASRSGTTAGRDGSGDAEDVRRRRGRG